MMNKVAVSIFAYSLVIFLFGLTVFWILFSSPIKTTATEANTETNIASVRKMTIEDFNLKPQNANFKTLRVPIWSNKLIDQLKESVPLQPNDGSGREIQKNAIELIKIASPVNKNSSIEILLKPTTNYSIENFDFNYSRYRTNSLTTMKFIPNFGGPGRDYSFGIDKRYILNINLPNDFPEESYRYLLDLIQSSSSKIEVRIVDKKIRFTNGNE